MRLVVSNSSGIPIYEQLKDQLKAAILAGEVAEGDALPSIRALARDLRVSVITTTRAYSDLAAEGFIVNVPGKGSYVAPTDTELVREQLLRQVEGHLAEAIAAAATAGLSHEELIQVLRVLLDESDTPTSEEER